MDLPESSSSEPPPPWVILGRVARVEHDSVDEPGEISVELAVPPRVSTLTVPMSLHPKPNYDDTDKHPYVVAVDPDAGILVHVSQWPFVGFDLDANPKGALLVARGFIPADPDAGRDAHVGIATRVPDRSLFGYPAIANIKNVGLISRPGTGGADYMIAELRLNSSADDTATLLTFRSGSDKWVEREFSCPSMYLGRWHWSSHDVIAHDGKLWWVNLVWGLLGCDPFEDKPTLRHVKPPSSITDRSFQVADPPTVECNRMVTVSKGKLLFVEMVRRRVDPVEETMVSVHSLEFDWAEGVPWWKWMSGNSIGVMWASHSYRETGMPAGEVPVLALVHPTDPDVVYFLLKDYLFGFDMRMTRVTEFVHKPGLVDVFAGTRRPPPLSWRYVLAWELPSSLAKGKAHAY
jgi:hypothetical protein